jgi:hypothetical protein
LDQIPGGLRMRKRVVKQIIVRRGKLRVVHSFRFYESVHFTADFGQKSFICSNRFST